MADHRMDILGELPLEIAEMIFEYLRPEDLVNCFGVSKRWAQLVNNDHLWSRHMPYNKYVEKYWEDAVRESYDEGVGCRLMNRYLAESRIKNNMKQGHYKFIIGVQCHPGFRYDWHDGRKVLSTDIGLLLINGDQLKFKDTLPIILSDVDTVLSWDLRLLAISYKNFVFIYERKLPTVEFELLSLLAARPAGVCPGGLIMLSVVSCPKLDKESVVLFVREYRSDDRLECVFFTGVDSPAERRVCIRLYLYEEECEHIYKPRFGLWDIDRNRLVRRWKLDECCHVVEGWDSRGVCICANKAIKFYDVDMRPLTFIPIQEYYVVDLKVSYNFSVATILSFDDKKKQLVIWEKDSRGYRVLVDEFKEYIISVSPSTISYKRDEDTVAILAAPHWQVVAHVEVHYCGFHLTEFSDGSLFIIMRAEKGYIWHDIARQNTTEISEWPTDCGHKFQLPTDSQICFFKGAKLASITGRPDNFLSIIDYDK